MEMCATKKMKKLRIVVLNYTISVMQTTLKLESHLKSLVNLSCLKAATRRIWNLVFNCWNAKRESHREYKESV